MKKERAITNIEIKELSRIVEVMEEAQEENRADLDELEGGGGFEVPEEADNKIKDLLKGFGDSLREAQKLQLISLIEQREEKIVTLRSLLKKIKGAKTIQVTDLLLEQTETACDLKIYSTMLQALKVLQANPTAITERHSTLISKAIGEVMKDVLNAH